jgi:Raf kinase inhibitor-like YbhB/YbcL family protein
MGASVQAATLTLISPAFQNGGPIPQKYTCDGGDNIPPLAWSGAPQGTKSFALIVDDPDAPKKVWVHWVVYNIPASVFTLSAENHAKYPAGTNDFGNKNYGGPCPPSGTHHYHFTLYALDTMLPFSSPPSKDTLLAAMKGHILEQVTLIGTYTRKKA